MTISIEECRKHLGELSDKMTDEQVIQLRDALESLIDQALNRYFERLTKRPVFDKGNGDKSYPQTGIRRAGAQSLK